MHCQSIIARKETTFCSGVERTAYRFVAWNNLTAGYFFSDLLSPIYLRVFHQFILLTFAT